MFQLHVPPSVPPTFLALQWITALSSGGESINQTRLGPLAAAALERVHNHDGDRNVAQRTLSFRYRRYADVSKRCLGGKTPVSSEYYARTSCCCLAAVPSNGCFEPGSSFKQSGHRFKHVGAVSAISASSLERARSPSLGSTPSPCPLQTRIRDT
eukprot:105695-Rhodomonas_salina.5